MNKLLLSALVVLALSILCFLLGGAGVAGAVTGGGQASGAVDVMFFFAKLFLGLALVLGVVWLIARHHAEGRAESTPSGGHLELMTPRGNLDFSLGAWRRPAAPPPPSRRETVTSSICRYQRMST